MTELQDLQQLFATKLLDLNLHLSDSHLLDDRTCKICSQLWESLAAPAFLASKSAVSYHPLSLTLHVVHRESGGPGEAATKGPGRRQLQRHGGRDKAGSRAQRHGLSPHLSPGVLLWEVKLRLRKKAGNRNTRLRTERRQDVAY